MHGHTNLKIHGINLGQKITKHWGSLVWCQRNCKLWNIKITACSIVCVFGWLTDFILWAQTNILEQQAITECRNMLINARKCCPVPLSQPAAYTLRNPQTWQCIKRNQVHRYSVYTIDKAPLRTRPTLHFSRNLPPFIECDHSLSWRINSSGVLVPHQLICSWILVTVCRRTWHNIPEGPVFISDAVRTSDIAFIVMFPKTRLRTISWARWFKSISSYPFY
jgi:hypothetical protein